MNRQCPSRLVTTPPAVPGNDDFAYHPPIWQQDPDLPIMGSAAAAIMGFCFLVLWSLPVLVLTILLLLGAEAMLGEPRSDGSSFTTALLIQFLLGFTVLMGLVFAWIFSVPRVLAFTFDENQQLLTLTVSRRGRKPTEVRVPYSDIIGIYPYVFASYDRDGHFSVLCQGPRGKQSLYRLAEGTSLEEMEFHSAWLRGALGERMHNLADLDK